MTATLKHLWLIACVTVGFVLPATGQQTLPSSEYIDSLIRDAELASESSERTESLRALRTANQNLTALQAARDATLERQNLRQQAADRIEKLQTELANTEPPARPPLDQLSLNELESARTVATHERDQRKLEADRARDAQQGRVQRRAELPIQLSNLRSERQNLEATSPPATENAMLREALALERTTKLALLEQRIAELVEEERNLQDTTLDTWRRLEVELSAKRLAAAEQWLTRVSERVESVRLEAAKNAEKAANRQAAAARDGHPLIAHLTRWSAELARERSTLTERLSEREQQYKQLLGARETLERDAQDLTSRVELAGGVNDAIGQVLRQRRRAFQRVLRDGSRRTTFSRELSEQQLRSFELSKLLESLERDGDIRDKLAAVGAFDADRWTAGTVPDAAFEGLDAAATKIQERLDDLAARMRETSAAANQLIEIDAKLLAEASSLHSIAVQAKRMVDEHVLWLRSTTPVWTPNLNTAKAAYDWLISRESWGTVIDCLQRDAANSPVPLILLGVLGIALIALGGWARRRLASVGEAASNGATATLRMTLWAVVLTAITALPIPLVFLSIGHRLAVTANPDSFALACATGLSAVGWLLLTGMFAARVAANRGLAVVHFRWPSEANRALRRQLAWALPIAAPLTWVLTTLRASGNEPWSQAGGRPALLALILVIGIVLWRLLHPHTGVVGGLREDRAGLFVRWSRLWYWVATGTVASLGTLSLFGFQFTAVELTLRLLATLGLVFGLLIVHAIILRGLVLARRDLARARVSVKASEGSEAPVDGAPQQLADIGQQSRALVRGMIGIVMLVGAWLLWVDVVPALAVLREFVLWSDTVDGVTTEITLASFLLASVYVAVTIISARNIPGALELTILRRLNIHQGERHALKTIARYLILMTGFAIAFSAIGVGWTKVQWLVAALGVGLGFGLQEIFANFVSGIIILVEQPVRVGDYVTVSETDGYVSQIRMRATVVTDLDRKELIIPNKEFITGRVVNWSLTDPVLRIVIKVGVAYGTDAELVRKVLLDVAQQSDIVLRDPAPRALFAAFGDSTLDFQLRCYIASMDHWADLMNDIHTRIQRAFAEHDIEIAFPQRDLHVRTAPGLIAYAEHMRDTARE